MLETSRFAAAAADLLRPPPLTTTPGSVYFDRNRNYNMVIGGAATPGGRIWAAWVSGGDDANAYFVLASSDDDGRSWSAPRLVIDPPDHPIGLRVSVIVGNLWSGPTGRLWLFFDCSFEQFDGRAGTWCIHCDNPDDDMPGWSVPRYVGFGMALNKPIVLASGTWLLPVSLWDRRWIAPRVLDLEPRAFAELDRFRMSNVFASDDQGRTWSRRGGVQIPRPQFDEAELVARAGGELWMTCRSETGIWESLSTDDGATWTTPRPSSIGHINARHCLFRLRSGRLLLVKHGQDAAVATAARHDLTAFVSEDDGRTWLGGLLLERRRAHHCSYPDGFQLADERICVMYDYGRDTPSEILLTQFTEEDVLAGRLITPGSRLAMLVSRASGAR